MPAIRVVLGHPFNPHPPLFGGPWWYVNDAQRTPPGSTPSSHPEWPSGLNGEGHDLLNLQ